jgi:flavin reductase (DIM6/NTAB) family NADH-FMN oxidoreductase RutF
MNTLKQDHAQFRIACSKFPTGVTVTTVCAADGTPHGITVSSFTSVSLEPPLVLICIDYRSQMMHHLGADGYFGINILSAHQQDLSTKFAKNWNDRFKDVSWYPGATGVPLLSDVAASFECKAIELLPAGDHAVVIGEVLHIHTSGHGPLAYVNSSYTTLVNNQ